ncbi:NUDIX domain-containing protein [Candidatus Uhrbacteria bacterium]|nr:NUDIX domain-containing protein [Candidatus Uhrbacteria bacterium]
MHNLRVINAFIKNDRGQLWIPRRVASKRICPLALDMSVGGYVSSWETYNQALFREAVEEVNIDLNIVPYRFLIKLTPQDDDMYAFEQVYEINSNEDPDYNKKDFLEAFWMFPQEVMQKIEQGDSAKSDLPKLLRKIYKV